MKADSRVVFGLEIHKNNHPEIRKIRKEHGLPSIHGNKFWKSSILMIDYLRAFPPKKRVRVLEVGCGWGLAGIYCAKHFKADVTSLDADDSVFPYLTHHAKINGVKAKTWKCRYERVKASDLEDFDLVIGADVCFWDSMSKPLYNLARRARKAGKTRVVFTDPGRPPFREMAERSIDTLGGLYDNWHVLPPEDASGLVLDISK